MDIIDKVVGAVDRVADVISGEAKIYKSLRGKGLAEITSPGIDEEPLK